MAVMIVREESDEGEREFELRHDDLRRMMDLTGLDETTIYTTLSSLKPIEAGGHRWVLVRQ